MACSNSWQVHTIWKKDAFSDDPLDRFTLRYEACLDSSGLLHIYIFNVIDKWVALKTEGKVLTTINLKESKEKLFLEQNFSSSVIHLSLPRRSGPLNFKIRLTKKEINKTISSGGADAFELGSAEKADFLLPSYSTVCFFKNTDSHSFLTRYLSHLRKITSNEFRSSPYKNMQDAKASFCMICAAVRVQNDKLFVYPRKYPHGLEDSDPKILPLKIITSGKPLNERYFVFEALYELNGKQYDHLILPVFYDTDRKRLEAFLEEEEEAGNLINVISTASGILGGEKFEKREVEVRFSNSELVLFDRTDGRKIFASDTQDDQLILVFDDKKLWFYKNHEFMCCNYHTEDGFFSRIREMDEIRSKLDATANQFQLGGIYPCQLENETPAYLYVNNGHLYETNLENENQYAVSDVADHIQIRFESGYHYLNFIEGNACKYVIDRRLSRGLLYNILFEKHKNTFSKYELKTWYKVWGKQLSEFIMYLLFGDIMQAKHSIEYEGHKEDISEGERELQRILVLYTQIQAIKYKLEYLSLYLPSYLNEYDEDWLKSKSSAIGESRQIIGSSFDGFGKRVNFVINSLLRFVSEIERSVSRIETVLRKREMTFWDRLREIEITRAISPYYLINQAPNIAAGIFPSIIKDSEVGKVKSYGPKALKMFDNLIEVFLKPLIIEASKATYETISSIISRDLDFFEKSEYEGQIKKDVFQRYLKLDVLCLMPLETEFHLRISDIIRELYSMIRHIDYSSFPTIE